METLRQKQSRFAFSVTLLILYAIKSGYEVTLGDAYRHESCPYGAENSLHKKRLAIDLNLFKYGQYLPSTEAHLPLGEFWESLGPDHSWGGRFGDGNHYSIEHDGMK